jgi:hypothetical protein
MRLLLSQIRLKFDAVLIDCVLVEAPSAVSSSCTRLWIISNCSDPSHSDPECRPPMLERARVEGSAGEEIVRAVFER